MTEPRSRGEAVRRLLDARSVAVVGASDDPQKVGFRPVDYLVRHGFDGKVYPVNPRLHEVHGLPCYPTLADLPEVPDVVAVLVGAPRVAGVLEEAGAIGVSAAVVISSGFGELGEEGRRMEAELRTIADRYGMALCGPNSVGYIHRPSRLALTFTEALTRGELTRSGGIGIVSQSGAFGTVIYALARDMDLGLRTYLSSGNEASMGVADFMAALVEDPDIVAIGGYVEAIRDGPAFREAALEARRRDKPVVLVKVGVSAAGTSAAASHTGALTGDDRVYEAAFRRFGVARADDEQHLLDALDAFETLRRLPTGRRIAVVSTSGGAGVLISDELSRRGLELAVFPERLRDRLAQLLPPFAAFGNPVDLTGQFVVNTTGLETVLETIASDSGVDAVVLFAGLGWTARGTWVDAVCTMSGTGAPVLVVAPLTTDEQRADLRAAGVPTLRSPIQAVRVLDTVTTWAQWRPPAVPEPLPGFDDLASGSPSEPDLKHRLADAGLAVPSGTVAFSAEETAAAAARIGRPVVLKIQAGGLLHKTEIGGVRVGVALEDAADVHRELCDGAARAGVAVEAVLVEEMADSGVDAVIGAVWREPFGHLVMVGLGGVTVEMLGDVAFALGPVGTAEARMMVESLRSHPLLAGHRGSPRRDIEALAKAVSVVSQLCAAAGPRLRELDLNPVRVFSDGDGVMILDAAAIVDEGSPGASAPPPPTGGAVHA